MNNFIVLVKDHLVNSFKSKKGIVFLLLYLAVFLLIAYLFFKLQNNINAEFERQKVEPSQRVFIGMFVQGAFTQLSTDQQFNDFILHIPFINIALFMVAILGTPLLILILTYDKIAQEVYDGTLRYLLFRTSRFQIYFAKFLSSAIEVAVTTFVALFIALLWGSFEIRFFDISQSMWLGLRFWLIAQPFLWVFIAFSLIFSSIFRKPFHALLTSFLVFFGLVLLPFWVHFVSPFDSYFMQGLYYPLSFELIRTLLFYTLFTIVFLGIGFSIFQKKDL